MDDLKQVLIVGGGFAGLNAAKALARERRVSVTLLDRRNHHLFQPLLYQVAMAGLSPADIAAPIRNVLSKQKNLRVVCGELQQVMPERNEVQTDFGTLKFDYLLLACGAMHSYFGNDQWERFAPGLKTLEQATEIRRRVLEAFEKAELTNDPDERRKLLTFVVVGAGPTGVELAGAIGEMSRFTLAKDFRNIDSKQARVMLIEAGPRILPMFSEKLASRAMRDLEHLGVQTWTSSRVTAISPAGVELSGEQIAAATVLWAAGVKASEIGEQSRFDCDPQGRIMVQSDLSIAQYPHILVAGDQCCFLSSEGRPLPGVAPVAVQQGRHFAKVVRCDLNGHPRPDFTYFDKGQMATIGRSRAIAEVRQFRMAGFFAWVAWLGGTHLFLNGLSQSPICHPELGLVFLDVSARRAADSGQGLAVLSSEPLRYGPNRRGPCGLVQCLGRVVSVFGHVAPQSGQRPERTALLLRRPFCRQTSLFSGSIQAACRYNPCYRPVSASGLSRTR